MFMVGLLEDILDQSQAKDCSFDKTVLGQWLQRWLKEGSGRQITVGGSADKQIFKFYVKKNTMPALFETLISNNNLKVNSELFSPITLKKFKTRIPPMQ